MPRIYKPIGPTDNKAVTPGETKAPPKDPKKDGKDDKEGGGK